MILGLFPTPQINFERDLTDDIVKQNETVKKLLQIKHDLRLNLCLNTFNDQCYKINEIFSCAHMKNEKKNRLLIRKPPLGKNTFIRNVSSCVINRYNGYDIVKIAQKDCIISCFIPLYIVYDPIEDPNKIIKCYFTDNIHFAFRLKYSRRKRLGDSDMRIDKIHPYECQSCSKFNATKKGNDGHVATCS